MIGNLDAGYSQRRKPWQVRMLPISVPIVQSTQGCGTAQFSAAYLRPRSCGVKVYHHHISHPNASELPLNSQLPVFRRMNTFPLALIAPSSEVFEEFLGSFFNTMNMWTTSCQIITTCPLFRAHLILALRRMPNVESPFGETTSPKILSKVVEP